MAKRPLPTPEQLRQLLSYDPQEGVFFWKARGLEWFKDGPRNYCAERNSAIWHTRYEGSPALASSKGRGYLGGTVLGVSIRAHIAAWAIHYGEYPKLWLDHINGDRADNRIANLREVTPSENARNACRPNHNSSGFLGVSFRSRHSKKPWRAYIRVGGKSRELGQFKTFEEAAAARKAAESKHGYHPNHGRAAK